MPRLVTLCAVLLLGLPAAGQAAGRASPAEVVRRFAAELNEPYAQARPCRWLSARVRPLVETNAFIGLDPWLADFYAPKLRSRDCDLMVRLFGDFSADDEDGFRTRVAVGSVRSVARRGGTVQLRVAVTQRFSERRRLQRTEADVFLLRERGAWRVVAASRLWRLWPESRSPRSFAGLGRHLRWLERLGRRMRAYERALVRSWRRNRTAVATMTLSLPAPGSSRDDPLHDVLGPQLRRIADQRAATVDLRSASLSTAGGTVAFELRFRGAVPKEAQIDLRLLQLRRHHRHPPRPVSVPIEGRWRVSLHDGWASAWGEHELAALPGLQVSAVGDTLRLVGGAELRGRYGRIDLSRPLTWSVRTVERIPGGRPFGGTWSDQIPSWNDPAGIERLEHPPPG